LRELKRRESRVILVSRGGLNITRNRGAGVFIVEPVRIPPTRTKEDGRGWDTETVLVKLTGGGETKSFWVHQTRGGGDMGKLGSQGVSPISEQSEWCYPKENAKKPPRSDGLWWKGTQGTKRGGGKRIHAVVIRGGILTLVAKSQCTGEGRLDNSMKVFHGKQIGFSEKNGSPGRENQSPSNNKRVQGYTTRTGVINVEWLMRLITWEKERRAKNYFPKFSEH